MKQNFSQQYVMWFASYFTKVLEFTLHDFSRDFPLGDSFWNRWQNPRDWKEISVGSAPPNLCLIAMLELFKNTVRELAENSPMGHRHPKKYQVGLISGDVWEPCNKLQPIRVQDTAWGRLRVMTAEQTPLLSSAAAPWTLSYHVSVCLGGEGTQWYSFCQNQLLVFPLPFEKASKKWDITLSYRS